jgi:hypothetical protein
VQRQWIYVTPSAAGAWYIYPHTARIPQFLHRKINIGSEASLYITHTHTHTDPVVPDTLSLCRWVFTISSSTFSRSVIVVYAGVERAPQVL